MGYTTVIITTLLVFVFLFTWVVPWLASKFGIFLVKGDTTFKETSSKCHCQHCPTTGKGCH